MIDLNKYTLEELYDLNKRVVSQIRAMQKQEAKEKSVKFKVGQDVWFNDRAGRRVEGRLTRFLPKNLEITVVDSSGRTTKWKVSPHLVKSDEPVGVDEVLSDLGGTSVSDFAPPPEVYDKPKTAGVDAW